jgi:hypothetical protein
MSKGSERPVCEISARLVPVKWKDVAGLSSSSDRPTLRGRRAPDTGASYLSPPAASRARRRPSRRSSTIETDHASTMVRRVLFRKLRPIRPLALKPSLSSCQFTQAPCKHTLHISFRPNRQCARLAKGSSGGLAVRIRAGAGKPSCSPSDDPPSPRAHERRMKP